MTQRAHVEGVLALLDVDDVVTFVGVSPNNTPPPYRVLYPAMPLVADEGLCGGASTRTHDFQTTCVGSTVEQAQLLAEKTQTSLLEKRPTIAGRSTGLVRKEFSQPARRDDDAEDTFYAIDGWSFTSN